MKTPYIFTAILFLFTLTRCSQDYELKQSVFIEDPEKLGLPEYSEWGYNTFGAFYDRQLFVSNNTDVPLKVIIEGGVTKFLFQGQLGSNDYYYSNPADKFTMTITVNNQVFANYGELINLHQVTYDLTNPDVNISIAQNGVDLPVTKLNGYLMFNRCQNLLVDKVEMETILSGTFDFQITINQAPVSISDGRFDVGVGRYNFFVL